MQFRYYNEKNENNSPFGIINKDKLTDGTAFNKYYPIIQLGIQSLPGVQFKLNHSDTSIIIGSTGIYELDLEGYTEITNLEFDAQSFTSIENNPNGHLIIDIISNKEEI